LAVHRRLAVAVGLWIAFQSVTGLVLVFRDPIEHRLSPRLTRHGQGDLGAAAALDAVHREYPGGVVGALATPEVSDGVYVVMVGHRQVYVDPASARINGARDHDAGALGLVARLHRRFLFDWVFGLSGARLVGALGFAWVVLSVTGLTSGAAGRIGQWWRRGQLTGRWWRPLPAGTRRTAPVLHRTIGFVVVAPMVLVAVTGIRLALPAGSDRLWAAVTGSGEGRYDTPPGNVTVTSDDRGGAPLDATQMLQALDRQYPDDRVARLLMPDEGDRKAPVLAGVSVGLDPGRADHDYGGNTVVFLDQYSAATLWEGRPDSVPAARQAALLWARPLHTGSVAGSAGRLIWGWLALAVVALTVAGYATRRTRTFAVRLVSLRWQRQLRRRKVLAHRQRARGTLAARDRRRTTRRLRRRRRVQARIGAGSRNGGQQDVPAGPGAALDVDLTGIAGDDPPVEVDLTDTAQRRVVEIDLTDTAQRPVVDIDLTDAVVYESEITLESGDTLETGIVGSATPPLDAELRLRS
jgi:uncharacterized iron-regulated membrane protein